MAEKPAVLIIGGLGYIGRFLALHIQKNDLASELRIVDKVCKRTLCLLFSQLTAHADATTASMAGPRIPGSMFEREVHASRCE
jgi:UDP-glucose 4-epimerase